MAASAALYTSAPVVVLAADGDAGGQAGAASAAVALGAPMLLTPGASADPADATAVAGEVARLGPQALLAVGKDAQDWAAQKDGGPRVVPAAPEALGGLIKVDVRAARAVDPNTLTDAVGGLDRAKPELLTVAAAAETPPAAAAPSSAPVGPVAAAVPDLPATTPAQPLAGLVVLARSGSDQVAPTATARAAGVPVDVLRTPDPRGSGALITMLWSAPRRRCWRWAAASGPSTSSGSGSPSSAPAFSCPEVASWRSPAGGWSPSTATRAPPRSAPGRAGPLPLDARAKDLVAQYQPHSRRAGRPGFRDHHDRRRPDSGAPRRLLQRGRIAKIRPCVDAAKAAGAYVMLDLQPGRTDFLTQAKRYQELSTEPHVGLALDPEWRLQPDRGTACRSGR